MNGLHLRLFVRELFVLHLGDSLFHAYFALLFIALFSLILFILPYIRERADVFPCRFSFLPFLSPPLHWEHPTSVPEIFPSLVRKT